MASSLVLVGQIGAAHGIRGEVRVKSFTEPAEAIADYGPLLAKRDGGRPDQVRERTLTVTRLRPADTMLVVKFDEIADRNESELLNGMRLYVERSALPETEDEDEFYHTDLIGLEARLQDGTVVGHILAVPDFGAGDLLEIRPENDGRTFYLPFTKAIVPVVSISGGHVVVVMPEEIEGDRAPGGDTAEAGDGDD